MSMLDWAGGLADQSDVTKAEFCILARFRDPQHSAVDGLVFDSIEYGNFAAATVPAAGIESYQQDIRHGFVDGDYLSAKAAGLQIQQPVWAFDSPIVLAHQVMFFTDFGELTLDALDVVNSLQSNLASQTSAEAKAELLIALHCSDAALDAAMLQALRTSYHQPASWDHGDYHPMLVIDLLFSMLGEHLEFQ